MPKKNGRATKDDQGGENVSDYFRKLFAENPKLIGIRSNAELLKRWQADHPGHPKIPNSVKAVLSNVKSVLRSKGRKRRARRTAAEAAAQGKPQQALNRRGKETLSLLEEQIDDCMALAKNLDRQRLENVIHHLRRARNEVVWKMGQ